MNKDIYIVGTGGFAREVLFLIDQIGLYNNVRAFLEPDEIWEKNFKDKEIMSKIVLPFSDFENSESLVAIGVADASLRKLTTTQLPEKTEYISLIHPNASISKWCKLGQGAVITSGCIVTTQIEIGDHCHLNLQTTIGHDCKIKDFFTTAPAVNISGACNIGNNVYFGTGAATRQGVTICDNVVIGMGAMVVKDITEPGVYAGIPAKRIK